MKKKLLLLVLSFALCLPMFAESICVNLKNGETVRFSIESVENVTICEDLPIFLNSVVDESQTPLKFKLLSDSTLEVIKDDSYQELDSVVAIPAKVRIDGKVYDVVGIGRRAFYSCYNITKVTIPSSISYIDDEAFYECPFLDVLVDNSNGIIYLGVIAFHFTNNVTYTHPEYVVDEKLKFGILTDSTVDVGLRESADYAFRPLGKSIEIPSTVKIKGKIYTVVKIANGAFEYGSELESFDFPPTITSIGSGAFKYCSKLKEINLPSTITQIEEETFMGCKNLKYIEIPESVTYIEDRAFAYDDSLDIVINNSKENIKIKKSAIRNCCDYRCKSVTYLKESTIVIDTTAVYDYSTLFSYRLLPDSTLEIIGDKGKYHSDFLTIEFAEIPEKVIIEDSYYENVYYVYPVTSISDFTFSDCEKLKSVKIPSTLTNIGKDAFYNCHNLTSIEIPSSVTHIGDSAFSNCENLDVIIDNSEGNIDLGKDALSDCKSVKYLK